MTQEEFKAKYFTNNFYWVNESNYRQLQEIALEMGCLCHTMKSEIIEWHTGFRNLGFNPHRKNPGLIIFQKKGICLCIIKLRLSLMKWYAIITVLDLGGNNGFN